MSRYLNNAAAIAWLAASVGVSPPASAQSNPFRTVDGWLHTPSGRTLGSVSSVSADAGGNVWIAERCGANDCSMNDAVAPILRADSAGRVLATFGAGMFAFPHGIYVDPDGNVWVTDARAGNGSGHRVIKFDAKGRVLLTLGTAGVAGGGPDHFNGPTGVAVAPNGDVFVTDGHETDSNNRVVKFTSAGKFIREWGRSGSAPGEFLVPHAIALDSRGRVFVADRDNNRVQIFDQEGKFLDQWTQFGRPSGLFITADDTLIVSDNQSNTARHPGWTRGIRIGSARDGVVRAFIPDPDFDPSRDQETGAHGIAADSGGHIYGAEVWSQTVKKYEPR
ncbi:MAG TPA: peptidyl-alpha-hydroxyglycine alpha-amidating lyase family protein [Gammaproteobacteria bacterium]|nr:peptidyl-alpha-hydroxyglycine alpha-amidating lyase family protein [Gammaproteobacteria bacterium]